MEQSTGKRKIWLDCDPGHDDAFAIMLAGHNDKLELLGVSTVAGNQTLEKTTRNALTVLAISGLDSVDVVPGQAVPLVQPPWICPEIHGESGLDSKTVICIETKCALPRKAINHIYDVVSKCDSNVTLVATGCLSNYALLLTVYPEIKAKIDEIVILGGAMGVGNITPVAEFNFVIDPEAARIVYQSGCKIVQIPLEVTHTCCVTPEILARIRSLNSPFGALMEDLLLFFGSTYKTVFNFDHPPLHDPLAVAYVIDPALFETTLMRVDVETSSPLCRGQTVCDLYHMSSLPKNAHVATRVNVAAFWDLVIDSLQKSNAVSVLNTPEGRDKHLTIE